MFRLTVPALCALLMLPAGESSAQALAGRACPHCAWVEARREIVPVLVQPGAARVYEYTVRMSDGSSRVFLETMPAGWRLRERLIVIDGGDPAAVSGSSNWLM